MTSISGIGPALFASVGGLDRAIERVEQSAVQVAASPETMSFAREFEALIHIHNAGLQAAANAAVLQAASSLYHQLLRLPRK